MKFRNLLASIALSSLTLTAMAKDSHKSCDGSRGQSKIDSIHHRNQHPRKDNTIPAACSLLEGILDGVGRDRSGMIFVDGSNASAVANENSKDKYHLYVDEPFNGTCMVFLPATDDDFTKDDNWWRMYKLTGFVERIFTEGFDDPTADLKTLAFSEAEAN